jgi:hypothetical protein
MRELKDIINESFSKEYGYRIKLAKDCTADDMSKLESCLQKYNLVSTSAWKRLPIQENPMEFQRLKGASFTSEVCSTDVILKYPVNQRILEVWLSVNLNVPHDRVLCYSVNDPRKAESDMAADRMARDQDRTVDMEEAELLKDDMGHYVDEQEAVDDDLSTFGEGYSEKFVAELKRIRDEKGADYFKAYPTKDELMGDNLRAMHDSITGLAHGGQGGPEDKMVGLHDQGLRH